MAIDFPSNPIDGQAYVYGMSLYIWSATKQTWRSRAYLVGAHGGSGTPESTIGVDGDFYFDTTNLIIYGPKSAGAWGTGQPLRGETGPAGPMPSRTVGITIDAGQQPITPGFKGYATVGFSGTIKDVKIIGDTSGSIQIDVWKTSNSIPTVANTITAGNYASLTNSQYSSDTVLAEWNKTINISDVFGFNVVSASTVKKVTLSIIVN